MILYFSGTGNSRYIARKIAAELDDEIVNVGDKIKSGNNDVKEETNHRRRRSSFNSPYSYLKYHVSHGTLVEC